VVLKHLTAKSDNGRWNFKLPEYKKPEIKKYALALWVNKDNDLSPLQATGGWLEP